MNAQQDNGRTAALAAPERADRPARKPYAKPKVVEFGDVRELTRGSGGSKSDAKTGSQSGH